MSNIDQERITGNYGEHLVSYLLGKHCLIRPVAAGTDVGIDLYCEHFEESGVKKVTGTKLYKPFLHFWVQVKSGKNIYVYKNKKRASYKFKYKDLKYWERQPIPVYAFLVPFDYQKRSGEPEYVYIVDISFELFGQDIDDIPETGSRTLSSIMQVKLNDDNWYDHFIMLLKHMSGLITLKKGGFITQIPELYQSYFHQYPSWPGLSKYAKKAVRAIRMTSGILVKDAIDLKKKTPVNLLDDDFSEHRGDIEKLVEILQVFETERHTNVMTSLFNWALYIKKDVKKAKFYLKVAKLNVQSDPNLQDNDREKWLQELNALQNKIE